MRCGLSLGLPLRLAIHTTGLLSCRLIDPVRQSKAEDLRACGGSEIGRRLVARSHDAAVGAADDYRDS